MTDEGKVYNVELVDFIIDVAEGVEDLFEDSSLVEKLDPIVGIAEDGFGVTPTAETATIPAIKGEQGFSVDPSNGAEISLTLVSTSESVPAMIELHTLQQQGKLPPFEIRVEVADDPDALTKPSKAFGFRSIIVENAMLVNYAPFETDTREAPNYEFEMVGYGYKVNKPVDFETGNGNNAEE